jgi:leucyl-tRNA synthetase
MTTKMKRNDAYEFEAVEQKYKHYWDEIGLYETGDDPEKSNYYILDFFP